MQSIKACNFSPFNVLRNRGCDADITRGVWTAAFHLLAGYKSKSHLCTALGSLHCRRSITAPLQWLNAKLTPSGHLIQVSIHRMLCKWQKEKRKSATTMRFHLIDRETGKERGKTFFETPSQKNLPDALRKVKPLTTPFLPPIMAESLSKLLLFK